MVNFKNLFSLTAIKWKIKQQYSIFRCSVGGGFYIYKLDKNTKFVSYSKDALSHVFYVCNGHEKIELNWCENWLKSTNQNQVVIDCGANIGYFSAILSQRCSNIKILAIEGNDSTVKICQQTFDLLNINTVKIVPAVLSDKSSEKYIIPNIPGREAWQQAKKINSDILDDNTNCYTTTLDELIDELNIKPSLVKIDCEGFETLILQGANNLLHTIRPAFMIECNDKALVQAQTNRNELLNLLRKYNYKLFHLCSFTGFQPFGLEVDNDFPSSEFNFAAIPNDDENLTKWNKSIQNILDQV
ncbi:MAG: FkbM family methyltransferase [Dolichospermum sp.]